MAVKLGHTTSPNARASGYAHTYFDAEDMNIKILSEFPTDVEIERAAKEAWEEADGLFTNLGVSPSEFMGPNSTAEEVQLPSIGAWYTKGQDPVLRSSLDADDSEESTSSDSEEPGMDDGYGSGEEGLSDDDTDTVQLQKLIDTEQMNSTRGMEADNKILSLTCAAVAVQVDEIMLAYV
jgi:hypothetical protein